MISFLHTWASRLRVGIEFKGKKHVVAYLPEDPWVTSGGRSEPEAVDNLLKGITILNDYPGWFVRKGRI